MLFDSLIVLAATVAQPPAAGCGHGVGASAAAATPAAVSAMAACRKVSAVVDLEKTSRGEDLAQPAIFTSEGRNKAIIAQGGAGPIV